MLWPLQLNATNVPSSCSNLTTGPSCPARDWDTLTPQLISYYQGLTSGASTLPDVLRLNGHQAVREMYTKQSLGMYRLVCISQRTDSTVLL